MPYSILPEWAPQKAIWTAWPAHTDLWLDLLEPVRGEVAAMIRALAVHEPVKLLAYGDEAVQSASQSFADCASVQIVPGAYGDIWLRDTGPVFARDAAGQAVAHNFGFNYWGNKYDLPHDTEVGMQIAEKSGTRRVDWDFVLEGGSIDYDGTGRLLTTRSCLLNPNRNPSMAQAEIEARLRQAWGANAILWLDEGLAGDHTDGHIDNIARFIGPGRVVCQHAAGADDPNAATYDRIARDLAAYGLDVVRVPSPGRVTDDEGAVVPASHMNFIIANGVVVMPTYEETYAREALAVFKTLFEDRDVVGLPAHALLAGGGSFHCITQQEPL